MAALGIRGKGANAAAVPLAHGGAAYRAAESPPSGNGIDHCLSRKNGRKPLKTLAFCRILWYNVCMKNREMQTSNTAEMGTISRAEYDRLQQEKARNAKLEAKNAKLEEQHARLEAKLAAREQEQAQVITSLTLQNEWLLEQLKLSKKKLFGRSSEQAEQMVMEQLSFTYVPAGTGIQSSGLEAVPADDGQLAAEGFGEMAAAGLRCAA